MDAETAVRHQRFREAGGVVEDEEQQRLLDAILWQSPYLSAFLIRDPAALQRLARDAHLRREKSAARMRKEIAGQSLRRYRNQEYLRLGARELGWGKPVEVGRELSHLADACLDEAIAAARQLLIDKHGAPLLSDGRPCRFVVFGMGKLGGEELNFSSDIDLIYVYESDQGGCPSGLTLHEYFSRLSERVTRAIGDVTDEGFCFRVDMRLRPEGSRGPLANSLPASERYYESWGRPWERQAWLKARPVAGDLDLGWEMLSVLEPFVWPRSSGPSVIAAVHELMGKIRAELGTPSDVKVGPGGIREIEFFVQALQMVHSRLPSLRERNTRRALDKLLFAGLIDEREHRALTDAYDFLRRLEHRLQLEEGRQTHTLPGDRGILSQRLGFADVAAFDAALAQHRRQVTDIYATLGVPEEAPSAEVLALVDPAATYDIIRDALDKLGFADASASADEIELLRGKPQSPFAAGRPIAPIVLGEVTRSPDPDLALRRLVDLVGRRGEGAGIWRLMEAHRPLLTLLVSLFGTSEYLGKVLVAHPELLEELLVTTRAEPIRPREKLEERVAAALKGLPFDDEEGRLNALRRFKNEEVLRVGLYDIAGELTPQEVSSQLSDLAETVLEATLATIAPSVFARWGTPKASLAVVALGKLGARELTYASDLDLIFVYSDDGDDFEIFSRLGQRLIHALGAYLEEGRLYEVDTRLRPSGQQGTLVSSLAAFRAYHAKQALLWERQALIKIRTVAGDGALGKIIEDEAAQHIWSAAPDPNMAEEIGRLRARMEKELAKETQHRFNIKSGRGGLLDIEFLTQYLQLREGPARPSLRLRGTAQALVALRDEGILSPDVAAALADSYAFLRRLENRLRIVNDRSIAEITDLTRDLDKLARRCGYHGESPGARLLADYRAHTDSVRALYARYLPAANLHSSPPTA